MTTRLTVLTFTILLALACRVRHDHKASGKAKTEHDVEITHGIEFEACKMYDKKQDQLDCIERILTILEKGCSDVPD
jgi:hypothetical protein